MGRVVQVPAAGGGVYRELDTIQVTLFSTYRATPVFHRHDENDMVPWPDRRTACGRPLWGGGPGSRYTHGTWLQLRIVLGGAARPCKRCWS